MATPVKAKLVEQWNRHAVTTYMHLNLNWTPKVVKLDLKRALLRTTENLPWRSIIKHANQVLCWITLLQVCGLLISLSGGVWTCQPRTSDVTDRATPVRMAVARMLSQTSVLNGFRCRSAPRLDDGLNSTVLYSTWVGRSQKLAASRRTKDATSGAVVRSIS